jgi:hypothetical protein
LSCFFLSCFFLDELLATDGVMLVVIGFFGAGSRQVSLWVRCMGAVDFEGILAQKTAASPAVGLRKPRVMQEGMRERDRLVGLENSELLAGLSDLVRRSNELTGDVLAHLAELEERKLHLELGFTSTFAYCVEALGMSEGAAGRRVTAARVCRRFPEAFGLVAAGELHLSALCELAPRLNSENASELFEACRRKTRRQVEGVLAARIPRPDVREQIRRLPVRAGVPFPMTESRTSERDETQQEAFAQSAATEQQPGAASAEAAGISGVPQPGAVGASGPSRGGAAVPRRRELEALSADRFGVHFTADVELRYLIERARAVASHRLPKGDLASLMKLALTTFVQQEEKRRFAVGGKPRKAASVGGKPRKAAAGASRKITIGRKKSAGTKGAAVEASVLRGNETPREDDAMATSPGGASLKSKQPCRTVGLSQLGTRGRYIAAAVRREVYLRDCGRCSFVSADGRRCGARAFLEFDHIEPWAVLGASVADNLRLRCRAHNGLHARNCFGALHIAGKITARRREAQLRITSLTLRREVWTDATTRPRVGT